METKKNTLVIEPSVGWKSINVKEIWQYRELLFFLAWRDLIVRYKQTLIGVMWAIIQPFLTMVVFSVFFGKFAKMPSEGVAYPIFVYIGLLPWTLFSQSLTRASDSIVSNSNLIKKVYFPRLITPMAASFSALVDFCIAFTILVGMMVYYKFLPSTQILLFPVLILLTFFCSVGLGLWLASLNAMYRDIRYVVPFLIQLGLFITPVIYPVSIAPENWEWVLYLNPMAGIIEGCRAVVLGHKAIPTFGLMLSTGITLLLFSTGLMMFRKMEKQFADVV